MGDFKHIASQALRGDEQLFLGGSADIAGKQHGTPAENKAKNEGIVILIHNGTRFTAQGTDIRREEFNPGAINQDGRSSCVHPTYRDPPCSQSTFQQGIIFTIHHGHPALPELADLEIIGYKEQSPQMVRVIVAVDRIAATTTRVNRDMWLLSAPTSRPLRFLADSESTFLSLDGRQVASPANWAL